MSILALFVALLLSGSSSVTAQPNSISSGGPISAPQAAATTSTPTVDIVYGGGPTT